MELLFGQGIIGEGSMVAGMVVEITKSNRVSMLPLPCYGWGMRLSSRVADIFDRCRCWCPYWTVFPSSFSAFFSVAFSVAFPDSFSGGHRNGKRVMPPASDGGGEMYDCRLWVVAWSRCLSTVGGVVVASLFKGISSSCLS